MTAFDPTAVKEALQRRPTLPKNKNACRALIEYMWGELAVKMLILPAFSVFYNLFMGGVDIADQRQSYFTTRQRTAQT